MITGGAFGLEGGLACSMIFLIGIGIMVMRTRRPGEAA